MYNENIAFETFINDMMRWLAWHLTAIEFNVHLIVIIRFFSSILFCIFEYGNYIWLQHFWKLWWRKISTKYKPKIQTHQSIMKKFFITHLFRCWTISIGLWYKKCNNQWNRKSSIQTSKYGFTKFGYQSITITNASGFTISIGVDKSTLCHSCRTKSTRSTSFER